MPATMFGLGTNPAGTGLAAEEDAGLGYVFAAGGQLALLRNWASEGGGKAPKEQKGSYGPVYVAKGTGSEAMSVDGSIGKRAADQNSTPLRFGALNGFIITRVDEIEPLAVPELQTGMRKGIPKGGKDDQVSLSYEGLGVLMPQIMREELAGVKEEMHNMKEDVKELKDGIKQEKKNH